MIYEIKCSMQDRNGKALKNCLKSLLPRRIVSNIVFRKHHHRSIDYKNPTLLDEKLLVLKDGAYRDNPLIVKCTDKLAVREYLQAKGKEDVLVGLLGAYTSAEQIDWEALPEKFAIKCNHGSGYNVIVTDKKNTDQAAVYAKLERWLKQDYATMSAELHYRKIPRRIIAEEYIETKAGTFPVDYKFFASRGRVICALVICGRGGKKERIYVDRDFNDLHLIDEYRGPDHMQLKPAVFREMVRTAELLSGDFPFVRVDLYDKDGQVLFGELTFTPHGCCHDYLNDEAQKWIGEKITL